MISSYTQLLGRRYGDRFDENAREFMGYIVEGATRMKQLIEDLLAYSRVGTRAQSFGLIELETVLRDALDDLQAAIAETGAVVSHEPLPAVPADASQIRQLFQNLIGNAIKFRGAHAPRVHIAARMVDGRWRIAVRDNGIGIESEYADRIFVIFQRLHSRRTYPGTGVGLAICKKIVERHGGRIWVESQLAQGTTVFFELPGESRAEVGAAAAATG